MILASELQRITVLRKGVADLLERGMLTFKVAAFEVPVGHPDGDISTRSELRRGLTGTRSEHYEAVH